MLDDILLSTSDYLSFCYSLSNGGLVSVLVLILSLSPSLSSSHTRAHIHTHTHTCAFSCCEFVWLFLGLWLLFCRLSIFLSFIVCMCACTHGLFCFSCSLCAHCAAALCFFLCWSLFVEWKWYWCPSMCFVHKRSLLILKNKWATLVIELGLLLCHVSKDNNAWCLVCFNILLLGSLGPISVKGTKDEIEKFLYMLPCLYFPR